MNNRVEIPISGGLKLVAEQNTDPNYSRELYVSIEDSDGAWVQDLVCVQNEYRYKEDGELEYSEDNMRVMVWSGCRMHVMAFPVEPCNDVTPEFTIDDITHEFTIPIRKD